MAEIILAALPDAGRSGEGWNAREAGMERLNFRHNFAIFGPSKFWKNVKNGIG